jgi:hypothetical protein
MSLSSNRHPWCWGSCGVVLFVHCIGINLLTNIIRSMHPSNLDADVGMLCRQLIKNPKRVCLKLAKASTHVGLDHSYFAVVLFIVLFQRLFEYKWKEGILPPNYHH